MKPKASKPRIQGSFTARRYFSGLVPHAPTPKILRQKPSKEIPLVIKNRNYSKQVKNQSSNLKPLK